MPLIAPARNSFGQRFSHSFVELSVLATMVSIALSPAAAQTSGVNGTAAAAGGDRSALTRSVEPSFRIEPVVQRFRGRRGEVLPFSFEVQSTGKTMNVMLQAVNLRQEETGVILHDESSEPAAGVRFTSKNEFTLVPGEKFLIEGEVTVPLSKSNFLTFGILVRDSGQLSQDTTNDGDEPQTRAAIRFITQYVLRVDIETAAQDAGDMDKLHFDVGRLIQREGMPWVQAYLTNPTDYALECTVRATLAAATGNDLAPVSLVMPSRAALEGDERTLIRIMPQSRLRLEAPVDQAMIDGHYDIQLKLSNGRRAMVAATFPAHVDSSEFRALKSRIATVADTVSISPAQLELGRIRGSDRMLTITLNNSSDRTRQIQLIPRSHDGQSWSSVAMSSDQFSLDGGRSKTIRLLLKGSPQLPHEWGTLDVVCNDAASTQRHSLPLALLHQSRPIDQVTATELQWSSAGDERALVMRVQNTGEGYVPLFATVQLAGTEGHPITLADGFGQWLAPQQSRDLVFEVPGSTTPGSYQLNLSVHGTDPNAPFVTRSLVIELTEEMLGGSSTL